MQQESPLSESTSTPQGLQSDVASSKITRKSHRKSRAGCTTCKTRRIKCDEGKPQCGNCKRREVRCDFAIREPVSSLTSSDTLQDPEDLRISEIELTYHWSTTTSQSLSAWWSGAAVWQAFMGDVALGHRHVLHLMFALTALQLANCRPSRREEYVVTADRHYERALAGVTHALASISSDNCDAILLSVQLICFVSWARGPQPGEYLAFSDHGRSEWLVMFRGIRTTLESFGRNNFTKTHTKAVQSKSRPLPPMSEPLGYEVQLSELREHVSVTSLPSENEENVRAVDFLQDCYISRYNGVDSEYHVAFAWLYKMSDEFLARLQQHDAIPLIIYAHFVVLMHEMERFWYMKGWTHHVMRGIYKALGSEHTAWIRWPMSRVGFIAP